ncbi:MAG: hypothetical protein ACLRT4_08970 [Thomasclavelia sp.]
MQEILNYHGNYAVPLENIFRKEFQCDRMGVGGLVNADEFEKTPLTISTMLLCRLIVCSNPESEKIQKLKMFIIKYSNSMNKSMRELGEDVVKEIIEDIKNILG